MGQKGLEMRTIAVDYPTRVLSRPMTDEFDVLYLIISTNVQCLTGHAKRRIKGVGVCQGRPCDGRRHCVYVAMFYTRFQSAVNHVDQTTSVQN